MRSEINTMSTRPGRGRDNWYVGQVKRIDALLRSRFPYLVTDIYETRDRMRAFELIYHAARSGYVIAEYGVGLMYERGAGTARDLAKARRWLQRAADKGDEDAREKLKSLPTDSAGDSIETGTVMRAVKRSNVRDGPGKSYAKVDILEVGEAVRVIERTGNWLKLQPKRGQPERFVFGPLLSETGRSTVEQ